MNDSLVARLDKLERENRRLKCAGVAALVLIGTFVLMGQAEANKTLQAEKLILLSGTRRYAELGIDSSGTPALTFFDDSGKTVSQYRRGGATLFTEHNTWSHWTATGFMISTPEGHIDLDSVRLSITDSKNGLGFVSLGMQESLTHKGYVEPLIYFSGNNGRGFVQLSAIEGLHLEPGMLNGKALSGGVVNVSAEGPSLEMEDERGFKTAVGSTRLLVQRSGQESVTSASSIVLFGKDGKVIWSAP
jgi:hypothetical protein